jgi:hypothetical protein
MELVLNSGVLIAAEQNARQVSSQLAALEQEQGETEVVISSITVIDWSTVCIAPILPIGPETASILRHYFRGCSG